MKAFEAGDKVLVSAKTAGITGMGQMEALNATIIRLEETANGYRAARIAIETSLGVVVKLVFVNRLRRV